VARLKYLPEALADLSRLAEFLHEHDPRLADLVLDQICEAVLILKAHPMLGRPIGNGRHELIISRGRTGYIALYRFNEVEDEVLVLAVRHQREAGHQ
jgi:plasmid stabilization system protein ParE